MKKIAVLFATLLLLTACGSKGEAQLDVSKGTFFGGAVIATDSLNESETVMQSDATYVGVLVIDGKIADVSIDAAQNKATATEEFAALGSKKELGTDYGMAEVTGGLEWNEQIELFEKSLIGLEVKGLDVVDAVSGVTINTDGYVNVLKEAIKNLVAAEAVESISVGSSVLGASNEDGVEVVTSVVVVGLDAEGKAVVDTQYSKVITSSAKNVDDKLVLNDLVTE